jgi:hypothetical protein
MTVMLSVIAVHPKRVEGNEMTARSGETAQ